MSRNEDFDLRKFVEELTYEMFEEMNDEELEVPTIETASNYYVDYAFLPQFSLVDTENYSLWDDEENNITAKEKALRAMYENTSNLEKVLAAYNKVLQRKIESILNPLKEDLGLLSIKKVQFPHELPFKEVKANNLLNDLGETDLDKPGEFDNRRFL